MGRTTRGPERPGYRRGDCRAGWLWTELQMIGAMGEELDLCGWRSSTRVGELKAGRQCGSSNRET